MIHKDIVAILIGISRSYLIIEIKKKDYVFLEKDG